MPSSIALGLLEPREGHGRPADYLYARVAGRRSTLVKTWTPPPVALPGAADPRESCRAELAWLWDAMNDRLRSCFAPVFEYLELRTWMLCLRWRGAGEAETVAALLAGSLLARPIRTTLLRETGLDAAVEASARLLAAADPAFVGLPALYAEQGPGAFEQAVVERFLQRLEKAPLHPVIGDFFAYLIDARNLVALYKHLRWGLRRPPPLLAGGSLAMTRLETLWRSGQSAPLLELAGQLADGKVPGPELESALLAGLGRRLRRQGREPLQPGVLLDYLWRCHVEARNLELLRRAAGVGDELLARELIA